jgi:hypothetical protein
MAPAAIARLKRANLTRIVLVTAALALCTPVRPVLAEHPATTLATLLDRAQIEDMLVEYYGPLGGSDRDLGSYYTEDGILDVNGVIAHGRKPIEDLYRQIATGTPRPRGKFNMLLNNPMIIVNGDSATADVVWTGIRSETPKATPQLVEQGREHDELVKRDGRWYFTHRVITSDGGLPPMFEKTFKER